MNLEKIVNGALKDVEVEERLFRALRNNHGEKVIEEYKQLDDVEKQVVLKGLRKELEKKGEMQ